MNIYPYKYTVINAYDNPILNFSLDEKFIIKENALKFTDVLLNDKFHEEYQDDFYGKTIKTTAYILTEEELYGIINNVRMETLYKLNGGI